MAQQIGFDFEGVTAERAAFDAIKKYAEKPSAETHAAMIAALARLSDARCTYVLSHYSEAAFDVSLEKVVEYRERNKE